MPRLENVVYRWLGAQSTREIMLNAALVSMKEAQLLNDAVKHQRPDDRPSLKSSEEYADRLKNCYGLAFRRVYGEAVSAEVESVAKHMLRIRVVMAPSAPCRIWIADEYGLFRRQPPDWKLWRGGLKRLKENETRLPFSPCCSAGGTATLPQMIVNIGTDPPAFKTISSCSRFFALHASIKF